MFPHQQEGIAMMEETFSTQSVPRCYKLASIVQIGQPVQNSPKVNGNGAKWKQLANRAEADRHTLCKFLDGQGLFTGICHIYAATYKEMRDGLQPSSIESGQEDVLQAEQNKCRKGERKL
jgi:hypothetical protein